MMSKKIFLLYFFAAAFQVMTTAMADINQIRSEALRTIDMEAVQIMNLGKETENLVNGKKNIVPNINSQVKRQGKNIVTGVITQVEDDAQISFTKANMLSSNQTVFLCVFNEANSGENTINGKNKNFEDIVANETEKTNISLNLKIDAWYKDMAVQEQEYRKLYTESITKIFSSSSEDVIRTVVKEFQKTSSSFKTSITNILTAILQIHSTYLTTLENQVTALRTNANKDSEAVIGKIKACFK